MKIFKRGLDIVAAGVGVLVLAPLMLGVAAAVRARDGRPVFFRQERVGLHGAAFRMWKFRTMRDGSYVSGPSLTVEGDTRITRTGRFLRRWKLDELPQLFNVLRGDMSLVGPRPEVPEYVALYTSEQRRVLELRPGITDPASIRYRHESDLLRAAADPEALYIETVMPEKIRLNLEYARHANLFSDIMVILVTLLALLRPWQEDSTERSATFV